MCRRAAFGAKSQSENQRLRVQCRRLVILQRNFGRLWWIIEVAGATIRWRRRRGLEGKELCCFGNKGFGLL